MSIEQVRSSGFYNLYNDNITDSAAEKDFYKGSNNNDNCCMTK